MYIKYYILIIPGYNILFNFITLILRLDHLFMIILKVKENGKSNPVNYLEISASHIQRYNYENF